jgi:hypothetical protein
MQPQDYALEVVPSTPVTNVEIHHIAHTTQGQTSSKLTDTQSRRSDSSAAPPRLAWTTKATTFRGRYPDIVVAHSRAIEPENPPTHSSSYIGQPTIDHGHHTNSLRVADLI